MIFFPVNIFRSRSRSTWTGTGYPRRKRLFHGTVIDRGSVVTGWWLWKTRHPTISVKLWDYHYREFCKVLNEITLKDGTHPTLESGIFEVRFETEVERDQYKVGEEVTLKISTAVPSSDLLGAPPWRLDGIGKKGKTGF